MPRLDLELDDKAQESIIDLVKFYGVESRAEIISKSLAILKLASIVEKTGGELFARKGGHETKIIVR